MNLEPIRYKNVEALRSILINASEIRKEGIFHAIDQLNLAKPQLINAGKHLDVIAVDGVFRIDTVVDSTGEVLSSRNLPFFGWVEELKKVLKEVLEKATK